MNGSTSVPIEHQSLIDLAKTLGYQSNEGGICFGLAWMGVQAALLGEKEFERFKRRLALIDGLSKWLKKRSPILSKRVMRGAGADGPLDFHIHKLFQSRPHTNRPVNRLLRIFHIILEIFRSKDRDSQALQQMIIEYSNNYVQADHNDTLPITQDTLRADNNTVPKSIALDIAAFLEGIEIYFQPDKYPHLFPAEKRPSGQHAERSFPLVAPIQHEGSLLKRIGVSCHACTKQNDLTKYFQSLTDVVQTTQTTNQTPPAFVLSNVTHAISMTYQNNQWSLIDANQGVIQCKDSAELARAVSRALLYNENPPSLKKPLLFSIEAYTTIKTENQDTRASENKNILKELPRTSNKDQNIGSLQNHSQWTLFHLAASAGDITTIQAVLQSNPNVNTNAVTSKDVTPLYIAALKGLVEVVKALLKQGADVNQLCNGRSPLWIAAKEGHVKVVKALLKQGADVNQLCNGRSPLWIAAQSGYVGVVEALLEKGANANQLCNGLTPLHIATLKGHVKVVEALLEKGAAVDTLCNGLTPLHIAAQEGHVEVVKALLKQGANANQLCNGLTPLHIAVAKNHIAVVRELVRYDANANQLCNGLTPLQFAIDHGYPEMVQVLQNGESKKNKKR